MNDEIWKDIEGYNGAYKVSNLGRVKSFCAPWTPEMIRKPVPDKDGYLTVNLKINGKYVCEKIHRLVANAFIPNPKNYDQINHMDEDRANNRVENLEWCDCRHNMLWHEKYKKSNKAVIQISDDGAIVNRFESIRVAAKSTGANETCISMVLHGKRRKAGGYKWEFQS